MQDWLDANLQALRELWHSPWRPLSPAAAGPWVGFFALFLLYAVANRHRFLIVDNVNLVVHEAGHLLFGWLGPVAGVWGGTILQWAVPFLLAAYFFFHRQPAAFAFCLFFFFENWLYTATYLADARSQSLPLVVIGDPQMGAHDWNVILGRLGWLQYDTAFAGVLRFFGWMGMIATAGWLGWRFLLRR